MSEYTGVTKFNNAIDVVGNVAASGSVTGSSHLTTLGPSLYALSTAPNTLLGLAAAVGSICLQTNGALWRKIGAGDLDWNNFIPNVDVIRTLRVSIARQTVSFTGLSGDLDGVYVCDYTLVGNGVGAFNVEMRPNAIAAGYASVRTVFDNVTANVTSADARIAEMASLGLQTGRVIFPARTGELRSAIATNTPDRFSWSWGDSSTVVNQLDFRATVANAFAPNTQFTLSRVQPYNLGFL